MSEQLITLDQAIATVKAVVARKKPGEDPQVDASTRFDDLKFDSLDVAELFVGLEELVGRELDPESGKGAEAVGDLVRLRPL